MGRGAGGREGETGVRPIVCDASVAVSWYAEEPWSSLTQRLQHGVLPLLGPTILLAEVGNAFLTKLRRGVPMPPGHVEVVLAEMRVGRIAFTPDMDLLDAAIALAGRLEHPIHDCFYLALCRRSEAALATFDTRLARLATALAIPLWRPEDS